MGRKLLIPVAILGAASALLVPSSRKAVAPAAGLRLMWDYPERLPASNRVFVVFATTNLRAGFHWWTNVAAPPVPIVPKAQEFFRLFVLDTEKHVLVESR